MSKDKKTRLIGIIFCFIGFVLCLYPWLSNYYYEHLSDNLIISYDENVKALSEEEYERLLQEAEQYNDSLKGTQVTLTDPFDESLINDKNGLQYEKLLSVDDTGFMAYLDIPCIDVHLPIFHGTSAEVLLRGIGHLEGSSLPIGGESTHSVLTGHTGENNAKLFTDLNELKRGDIFVVNVLTRKCAYKVIDINIILPTDTELLKIQEGKDLVTLVTCTPYGINSHRLLVTGERTEYSENDIKEAEGEKRESQWYRTWKNAILALFTCLNMIHLIWKCVSFFRNRRRRHMP